MQTYDSLVVCWHCGMGGVGTVGGGVGTVGELWVGMAVNIYS